MNVFITMGLRISILGYALLHFITYFYPNELMDSLAAVIGFVMLVLSAVYLKIKRFRLPLFLFLTGIAILITTSDSFFTSLQNGLLQMSNIIGLLAVVPMIGWVLNSEPYIEEMIGFAHKMLNTSRKFYTGVILFTHIISYFLLFGAIPMMYQFVNGILKNQQGEAWENFKGTALLRAFALSTLWVISIPSFTFVVEALNAPLWGTILQGFLITVCLIIIAIIFSHFEEKRYGVDLTAEIKTEIDTVLEQSSDQKQQKRKTLEFMFLFITLFGPIFIVHEFVSMPLLMLIPLVIMVWAVIYFLVKRRPGMLVDDAKSHAADGLLDQSYQFSVLVSAGVMIHGLNGTGFGTAMVEGVYSLQENVPFINVLYFLPLIVIILGFMGLGPLTVMVLVAGILESISLPYPPELIVLAVTSGSAISILLSPLIMPVIVLSGTNGLNAFKNGLKFNYKYAIVLYVVVQIYVQLAV